LLSATGVLLVILRLQVRILLMIATLQGLVSCNNSCLKITRIKTEEQITNNSNQRTKS